MFRPLREHHVPRGGLRSFTVITYVNFVFVEQTSRYSDVRYVSFDADCSPRRSWPEYSNYRDKTLLQSNCRKRCGQFTAHGLAFSAPSVQGRAVCGSGHEMNAELSMRVSMKLPAAVSFRTGIHTHRPRESCCVQIPHMELST